MQLYEWAVTACGHPGSGPVGITTSEPRARERMLDALPSIPAGVAARGQVTAVTLAPGRLSYNRLAVLARLVRDADGGVRWLTGDLDRAAISPGFNRAVSTRRLPARTTVIDGHRLRALRRARGLSQENLAWTAGVGVTTVARLERQARPPCRCRTVALLARVLGEDPKVLITLPSPVPHHG
ncbi:MAG: helix-turn-helix domain-containing protein [Streptosporangiaceae bacterium]